MWPISLALKATARQLAIMSGMHGIVYDGALRDVEGLKEIGGFTSYYTSYDPSYHNPQGDLNTMIVGINQPTRIRTVTVMSRDVVLGKLGVVVFVPPQLAERVVKTSEIVRLPFA